MGKNKTGKRADKTKKSAQSKYKCELCDDRDKNKPIVACDACDKWHHFACVNIVSISKKDVWLCDKCKASSNKTVEKSHQNNCELCQHPDNDTMVRCNSCQRKYHFVCVEPDLNDLPKPFVCMECYNPKQKNVETSRKSISSRIGQSIRTSQLYERLDDFRTPSRQLSVHHSHQSFVSIQNQQLELDFLEDQRRHHEKWDREKEFREQQYLLTKYKLLKESNDPNVIQRSEYTEDWIKEHQKSQQRMDNEAISGKSKKYEGDRFDINDFQQRLDKLKCNDTSPLKQREDTKRQLTPLSQPFVPSYCPTPTKFDKNNVKLNQQNDQFGIGHQDDNIFVPSSNFHTKPASQLDKTLSKAQIASRHVIKSTLPQFFGDILEWTSWFSSYEESTNLCGYSDGENLLRLKECLKGKANDAVKHRLMSPKEVPNIIKTLRMLFGRPELIVNALLKNVKEIPAPKADKLETLVDYAMEVNNISSTIETAKLHYHLSNPTLIHELEEKLPVHTKIEWAKYKSTQFDITLKVLADWLYKLAEIVCTVTIPSTSKPDAKIEKKTKKQFERIHVHQVEKGDSKSIKPSSENNTSDSKVQRTEQCKICSKKCPDISQCTTFKSFNLKQRWDAVNKYKLCRKCLHCHNGYCRLTKECGINGCIYKHHPTLHNDRQQEKNNSSKQTAVVTNNFHHSSIPNILFRIVPVILYNNEFMVKTFAYLDEGSSGTLIEEELLHELQSIGIPQRLCLLWTNNVHRIEKESCRVDLEISGQNEFNARHRMIGIRSVKDLGLPTQTINQLELVKRFSYLDGIPLIDYVNERPRILIGLPHARLCTQLTTREGNEFEPVASKSRIGWSLHGPTREQSQNYIQSINEHRVSVCDESQTGQQQTDEELHQLVKEHFSLENFGVKINTDFNLNSKENERALKILNEHTKRVDGRFETALLWRYNSFELEDSYDMAKRRLICLEKSKRNYIQTINETIKDYIAKGYVSKLTPEDLLMERSKVGYLPIFIVVYPKKPDKLRMVFDAAARTKGTSLNDMLLKGPDQLNSLIDVLRRFREHPVAICADIFEMYHQVKVREEDKHVQRFLWRDGNTEKEPDVYVLNVMTFGAKCSPSAAQFVKNSNAEEFREELPKAVDAIVLNTYVDDMMDGDETDEKLIQLVNDVQKIHEHGGFKI